MTEQQELEAPQLEALTDPTLIPHVIDVAAQTGLRPEVFDHENLKLHNLAEKSAVIDLQTTKTLDEHGLIGVLEVGDHALKLYAVPHSDNPTKATYFVTAQEHRIRTEAESEQAHELRMLPLVPGSSFTLGRTARGAARLGIKDDLYISREHASLTVTSEGKLVIADLGSSNGTQLITAEKQPVSEMAHQRVAQLAGSLVSPELVEATPVPTPHEKKIDGVAVRFDGALAVSAREAYALTTTDEEGVVRPFFVYKSASEGSFRVSPGIESIGKHVRYMKGAEDGPLAQYTQDSQLHPKFATALDQYLHSMKGDFPLVGTEAVEYTTTESAEKVAADFGEAMHTSTFADKNLAADLSKLATGGLSLNRVKNDLEVAPSGATGEVSAALLKHIDTLNADLEKSGVIPDFDRTPSSVTLERHPLLGIVVREVYRQGHGGTLYEWHMVRDQAQGRVWIDRIRDAQAEPTPYGTDDRMVYSGILTSKPIEYKEQTTALPLADLRAVNNNYYDITHFLDRLAPIKKYRQQRHVGRATF